MQKFHKMSGLVVQVLYSTMAEVELPSLYIINLSTLLYLKFIGNQTSGSNPKLISYGDIKLFIRLIYDPLADKRRILR